MAGKSKRVFVCAECGGTSLTWRGQCPRCGAWNTMLQGNAAQILFFAGPVVVGDFAVAVHDGQPRDFRRGVPPADAAKIGRFFGRIGAETRTRQTGRDGQGQKQGTDRNTHVFPQENRADLGGAGHRRGIAARESSAKLLRLGAPGDRRTATLRPFRKGGSVLHLYGCGGMLSTWPSRRVSGGMLAFDEEAGVATKCFLCHGHPKCVEACPAAALRYVPWRDLTRDGGPSGATLSVVAPEKAKACVECHVPTGKVTTK